MTKQQANWIVLILIQLMVLAIWSYPEEHVSMIWPVMAGQFLTFLYVRDMKRARASVAETDQHSAST